MGPNLSFLEAAAQVIPVIFLALAVQNFFPTIGRAEVERVRNERQRRKREASGEPEFDADEARALMERLVAEKGEEGMQWLRGLMAKTEKQIAKRDEELDDAVRDAQRNAGIASMIVLFTMVLGEAAALSGLDQEQPNPARAILAAIGVMAGGGALLYPLIVVQLGRLRPDSAPKHKLAVGLATLVIVGCWLITFVL